VNLDIIKVLFIHQLMHKRIALKGILKFTYVHQQGPDNICSHTTRLTTPMYFNWLF